VVNLEVEKQIVFSGCTLIQGGGCDACLRQDDQKLVDAKQVKGCHDSVGLGASTERKQHSVVSCV
jgi:hypothetical protein